MKRLIICLCFLLPHTLFADDRWDEAVVDLIIKAHRHSDKISDRMDYLTQEFVEEQSPYVAEPLWEIFATHSDTQTQLREIPSGSILQFVRPRYDLVEWIGTLMHVSHQGIVVHKGNQVMLRHASTSTDKVTEEPLQDYLEKYWLSESCNRAWDEEYRNCMRGINILKPKSIEN
jgi:hypothetical protein